MLAHPQFAGRAPDTYGQRVQFDGFGFAGCVAQREHAVRDGVQMFGGVGQVLGDGRGTARRRW